MLSNALNELSLVHGAVDEENIQNLNFSHKLTTEQS